MRLAVLVLAAAMTATAVPSIARADSGSPSAAPATQQTPAPAAQPSPQATRLTDDEIRALLVGNSFTIDWREGMRLTYEVHPNGTVFGYVSSGVVATRGAGATRNQDDGKYTIGNGMYCHTFSGPWANSDGKPTCVSITRSGAGYLFGKRPMVVTPAKH
jgi:hypothetical protein